MSADPVNANSTKVVASVRDLVKIFKVSGDKGGAPLQLHAVKTPCEVPFAEPV